MILTDEQNVRDPIKVESISIPISDWEACKQRGNKLEKYCNILVIITIFLSGVVFSMFLGLAFFVVQPAYKTVYPIALIILLVAIAFFAISIKFLGQMKVSYCSKRSADSDKKK